MTYINLMGFKPLEAASFYTADKIEMKLLCRSIFFSLECLSAALCGVFRLRIEERWVF